MKNDSATRENSLAITFKITKNGLPIGTKPCTTGHLSQRNEDLCHTHKKTCTLMFITASFK